MDHGFYFAFLCVAPGHFRHGWDASGSGGLFSRLRQEGRSVGGLYAANTFGAVAGALATTFLIAPNLGFSKTLMVLCVVNLVCAGGVLLGAARNESERPLVSADYDFAGSSARILVTLFLTGLLGIGFEVLVVRVISQVLENTVYTFANVLSVYLLGTAAGAALYQLYGPKKQSQFEKILFYLLFTLSILCLLGIALLSFSETIFSSTGHWTEGGIFGAALGEASLAFAVFFLPTVAMEATFAHLALAARGPNGGLGIALSLNTLGATISPLLFGVILLPWAGSKTALIAVATSYLFLMPFKDWRHFVPALFPLSAATLMLSTSFNFHFVEVPPGGRIIAYDEGVMAAVSVVKDSSNEFHLKVNNKFQRGGTSSYYSDRRQGHIPLLLHPDPKRALFLGLGTGATFAACQDYTDLQADGVELLPEIIPLLPYFEKSTGNLRQYRNLHIKVADARRFVKSSKDSYDVVVADLFHPARDGAGSLYTVEHFEAIRARLNPSGIFCQWLPLYQLDLDMLCTIVRTFLQVFPNGSAFLAHYSLETPILGLVAGAGPVRYPHD